MFIIPVLDIHQLILCLQSQLIGISVSTLIGILVHLLYSCYYLRQKTTCFNCTHVDRSPTFIKKSWQYLIISTECNLTFTLHSSVDCFMCHSNGIIVTLSIKRAFKIRIMISKVLIGQCTCQIVYSKR